MNNSTDKMMKKVLLAVALMIGVCSVQAQEKVLVPEEKTGGAQMKFETSVVDYGTIEHKADGARKFIFTNIGDAPLIISNARGSCGCTVPTWPKEPIAPGATAEIGVKYATNRVGKFTKTITLTTNATEKLKTLTIKGEVLKPAEAPVAPSKPQKSPLEVN
tara:strand:- start:95 stop:577 length:483 start_codon:yes stop_codon:yes gene_type:complete